MTKNDSIDDFESHTEYEDNDPPPPDDCALTYRVWAAPNGRRVLVSEQSVAALGPPECRAHEGFTTVFAAHPDPIYISQHAVIIVRAELTSYFTPGERYTVADLLDRYGQIFEEVAGAICEAIEPLLDAVSESISTLATLFEDSDPDEYHATLIAPDGRAWETDNAHYMPDDPAFLTIDGTDAPDLVGGECEGWEVVCEDGGGVVFAGTVESWEWVDEEGETWVELEASTDE